MTKKNIWLIVVETGAAENTVRTWASGGKVLPSTDYACRAACKRLRIELPDALKEAS